MRDVVCFVRHRVVQPPVGDQSAFAAGQQAVVGVFDFVSRAVCAVFQDAIPKADFVDVAIEAFADGRFSRFAIGGYIAGGYFLDGFFAVNVEPDRSVCVEHRRQLRELVGRQFRVGRLPACAAVCADSRLAILEADLEVPPGNHSGRLSCLGRLHEELDGGIGRDCHLVFRLHLAVVIACEEEALPFLQVARVGGSHDDRSRAGRAAETADDIGGVAYFFVHAVGHGIHTVFVNDTGLCRFVVIDKRGLSSFLDGNLVPAFIVRLPRREGTAEHFELLGRTPVRRPADGGLVRVVAFGCGDRLDMSGLRRQNLVSVDFGGHLLLRGVVGVARFDVDAVCVVDA